MPCDSCRNYNQERQGRSLLRLYFIYVNHIILSHISFIFKRVIFKLIVWIFNFKLWNNSKDILVRNMKKNMRKYNNEYIIYSHVYRHMIK